MRDNTIGISRAALSHEQSIPPFCSSVRPKRAAAREEYICYWRVSRVVLAHLLVLAIADSFATLEGRPAAARAATCSAISECRVYNLDDRDGLVRRCGGRRVLSPMTQRCLRSIQSLALVRWVTLLESLGRCSVSLSEAPGTNKDATL